MECVPVNSVIIVGLIMFGLIVFQEYIIYILEKKCRRINE